MRTTATDTLTTHTDQAKDRLNVVLCGNSREIQAEDKGFEPSTGFPAPDFESGSNDSKANKNKSSQKPATHVLPSANLTDLIKGFEQPAKKEGIPAKTHVGGSNPTRADQLPNNKAAQNDLFATAQRSIQASRTAIAKLIDATPLDDHCTLERLGPILAELRAAESILNDIESPFNA